MAWSRKFIRAWLADHHLQFISGPSLNSLTTLANFWIRNTAGSDFGCPSVSSRDIKEAAIEVLGSDDMTGHDEEIIDLLVAIIKNDRLKY